MSASASSEEPSRVLAKVFCPHCVQQIEAPVLFHYGVPGAFQFGDTVRGTNAARVVADASVQGPCPACEWDGAWPVEVWLERDRIVSVNPPSRRFNWVQAGHFIALE